MEDKDKAAFKCEIKAFLYLTNGTTSPTDRVIIGYWNALKDFPLEKVIKTLSKITATEEGHQPPAKVARLITGKKKHSAKDEFDYLLGVLRKDGRRRLKEGELSEKGMKAYLAIGAWQNINVPVSQQDAARSMFYKEYDSAGEVR